MQLFGKFLLIDRFTISSFGLRKNYSIAMKTIIHLGARTTAATHEIVKLEAQNNYTLVHFIDGTKLLTSTTLGVLEERLSDYRFFRVNRSMVINLNYLDFFTVHY
jgi:DNA-binding LytR/AlgR family response regulator